MLNNLYNLDAHEVMRKCGGSERMKFFGLLGIYRTGSWIQIGSIDELSQKLTLIKK
jgi:hypothetical protein